VIALIAVRIGLRLPAVQKVQEATHRAQCLNNLRQMGLALHNSHGDQQAFPPGSVSQLSNASWVMPAGNCNAEPPELGPGWSFFAFMLPYIEQDNLHKSIRFDLPIADPANADARRTFVKTYLCPSDTLPRIIKVYDCGNPPSTGAAPSTMTDAAGCSYVGCLGGGRDNDPDYGCYEYQPFNGVFHRNSRIKVGDITAGLSNTAGVGERDGGFVASGWAGVIPGQEIVYNPATRSPAYNPALPGCQNWRPSITAVLLHGRQYVPNAVNGSPASFHANHTGGGNFLLMDGSCRFITSGIKLSTFRALCTRNNGEVIAADDL